MCGDLNIIWGYWDLRVKSLLDLRHCEVYLLGSSAKTTTDHLIFQIWPSSLFFILLKEQSVLLEIIILLCAQVTDYLVTCQQMTYSGYLRGQNNFGQWQVMLTGQTSFSLVMVRFWPIKMLKTSNSKWLIGIHKAAEWDRKTASYLYSPNFFLHGVKIFNDSTVSVT